MNVIATILLAAVATASAPPVRTAAELHALPYRAFEQGQPFDLSGTVAISLYDLNFLLLDDTGGVYVKRNDGTPVHPGDVVRVAELSRALGNGAIGAITKTLPKEELFAAIRKIAAGTRVMSPEIEHALSEDATMPELSPRHLEILHSLTRGLTNEDIARQLGLSTAGVKFHLLTIFRKLNVSNRAEAVGLALRKHLFRD